MVSAVGTAILPACSFDYAARSSRAMDPASIDALETTISSQTCSAYIVVTAATISRWP